MKYNSYVVKLWKYIFWDRLINSLVLSSTEDNFLI